MQLIGKKTLTSGAERTPRIRATVSVKVSGLRTSESCRHGPAGFVERIVNLERGCSRLHAALAAIASGNRTPKNPLSRGRRARALPLAVIWP